MTTNNVVALPVRRKPGDVSALTPADYNESGWLEITYEIYDWFSRNPNPHVLVHEYGFLHMATRRAFICLGRTECPLPLCAMSNRPYTDEEFQLLRTDEAIDAVIERLGYEPTTQR